MSQDNVGEPIANGQSIDTRSRHEQDPQESTIVTPDDSAPADLLHAAVVLPPSAIANVELTLDQLCETIDLFAVPPFDYGDAT